MRRGLRFALLVAVLGLAVPGSALGFGPLDGFGEFGGGLGQLDSPSQLAVAPDGSIYVADTGHDKIEVYSGTGGFLRSFGAGRLDEPRDVALDDQGRAYVADTGNHRIAAFSSSGTFVRFFGDEAGEGQLVEPVGLDVDASMFGSTVYVADAGNNLVASYTPSGDFIHLFGVPAPTDVVVGSGGRLYVADGGEERVDVFSKEGERIDSFGEGGEGELDEPVALAVDALGGIYVADRGKGRIFHFDGAGGFLAGAEAPAVAGVGVACQSNVFATEAVAGSARVQRFGEPGTPAPPCAAPAPVEPIVAPLVRPPSNRFHFAGLRKNRSNGFATLYVRVPGAGRLRLTGRGFRRLSRSARQATTVALPIKPKVRLRHFLRRHGKGRIRVAVTFTPLGGTPRSLERVVVLRRHRS